MIIEAKPLTPFIKRSIPIPGCDPVILTARRPEFADLVGQYSASGGLALHRLGVIVDWAGVFAPAAEGQEPKPLPFSLAAFEQACVRYPALLLGAVNFTAELFSGITEEQEGNSEGPPATTSAVAA